MPGVNPDTLYNGNPANFGGFTFNKPSTVDGYYAGTMGLPYFTGRSILASIPDYQRNPLALEKDLLVTLSEGRSNLMKMLYDYAQSNGVVEVSDVRYKFPIEISPNSRFYVKAGAYTSTDKVSTFSVAGNNVAPISARAGGVPNSTSELARIEPGQFIMLMFSWTKPERTTNVYGANGIKTTGKTGTIGQYPVPEICKVISVDYKNGLVTVERQWAGQKRGSAAVTEPATVTVVADSATPGANEIKAKDAFFVLLAKSMREDEIDAKIFNFTGTWAYGILQRHLRAWGAQHMASVISRNVGAADPYSRTRALAIEQYYRDWDFTSLFGEKSEDFDNETGYWAGTTDGILANIPNSHYVEIQGINYGSIGTSSQALGSFHPLIFNKILEDKAYIGSQNKVLLCGTGFHTNFATMINNMTQQIPDIKSEWSVSGKRFMSSNGLSIDVVPSDAMSLNGFANHAILFDKSFFKMIKLKGYPTDMIEINNENPLKKNGFIHGVQGFIDLNPDAHWVFTVTDNANAVLGLQSV